MAKYRCDVCGHTFDEEKEGKSWASVPADFTCPICGVDKSQYHKV
ncbi:MAG: rubredoxin [Mycoplasmataceae bacterium]|jgi:pyruvate oxidase|nr:rubredoxin [Mycoplasmataceae bacterium]